MNNEQFDMLCTIFLNQTEAINRLATAVETLVESQSGKKGANYIKPLSEYSNFDWSSIGAEVLYIDKDGVAAVAWKGRQYTRRCKPKYGKELWFSCCVGKDENGDNLYEKLIFFKDIKAIEVEPIPDSVKQLIPAPPKVDLALPAPSSEEFFYWQQQVRGLVQGLRWPVEQVKEWSKQNFGGKISTSQMTVEELKTAFQLLQNLVDRQETGSTSLIKQGR